MDPKPAVFSPARRQAAKRSVEVTIQLGIQSLVRSRSMTGLRRGDRRWQCLDAARKRRSPATLLSHSDVGFTQ